MPVQGVIRCHIRDVEQPGHSVRTRAAERNVETIAGTISVF
jgi:hypothetical protein